MSKAEPPPADALTFERLLIQFEAEVKKGWPYNFDVDPAKYEPGLRLLTTPREALPELVLAVMHRMAYRGFQYDGTGLSSLLSALLRKKAPWSTEQVKELIAPLGATAGPAYQWHISIGGPLRVVEDHLAESPEALETLRPGLKKALKRFQDADTYAEYRKAAQRIETMLAGQPAVGEEIEFPWRTREPWVDALRRHAEQNSTVWNPLLLHLQQANSSKPTKKWLTEANTLVAAIGVPAFRQALIETLAQVGEPAPVAAVHGGGMPAADPTLVHDTHSDLLRGLVWCAAFTADAGVISAVADATDTCFQKIRMIGPRAPKIGNACLWALSQMDSLEAVAEIGRAKQRAKHASIRTQIAKAMDAAAKRAGMSAADLEELAVPVCGLTEVGRLERSLGEFTAEITVGSSKAELRWRKADGKVQASVPAAVKADHAAELKQLQQTVKEIDRLLPAQRARIESLYLAQRSWPLTDFRTRYLDHPLVGVFARRLIWRFTPPAKSGHTPAIVDAIWHEGRLVDFEDKPLGEMAAETQVMLWHPLFALDEAPGWCDWLESRQICQPFQQAHRDRYELTAEERQAAVSTERFGGHILRQHQLAALCQQRGWKYSLQGAFDPSGGTPTPTLTLPHWKISVEFDVEPLEATEEVSNMGIFLYVMSGQVRFHRDGRPLALAEAPPLVFSETMRDVELFVGACTVGLDPQWAEGGPRGQFRDYWRTYALGALNVAAETRRNIVARVIPRLPIAERLSLEGRFVAVQGKLHRYLIHLGSGAVQIAAKGGDSAERLLPVLPKSPALDPSLLPFDGDFLLSQILETAFALTADDKIKDPRLAAFLRGK